MKMVETFILWGSLPLVSVAMLACLVNAPWTTLLVLLAIPGLPIIAGFLYGAIQGGAEYSDREAQRKRRDADLARQHVHQAQLPCRPDDVVR
jgi:hypothetical protein